MLFVKIGQVHAARDYFCKPSDACSGPGSVRRVNFLDPILPQREAKLRYLDADYQVLREGEFVRCAATGEPIKLDNLRYWNVGRQEPYASARVAFREYVLRLAG